MSIFNFPDKWLDPLGTVFCKKSLVEIEKEILKLSSQNFTIYPPASRVFRALELVDFLNVKVLILGQDPYHNPGQANGLSFSVDKGIKIPPSLKNIFVELQNDLNIPISNHGDLTNWAKQDILLLNSSLTVFESNPNSHKNLGWEKFTNRIIKKLSERGDMIFVLWGKSAQAKIDIIDQNSNEILAAPHPSPLSAHRGFFGCNHFSKINKILHDKELKEIIWNLP
ncbi:MAG: uracil-DNA glycosylase [Gammaproteobacteria bacterium]|nr:uracil-DNA glycosylase [Gammaproteobacteria bacterium]